MRTSALLALTISLIFLNQAIGREDLDYAKKRAEEMASKLQKAQSKLDRYNQLSDWISVYQASYDKHTGKETKLDSEIQSALQKMEHWEAKMWEGDSVSDLAWNLGNFLLREANDIFGLNFDAYEKAKNNYKAALKDKQNWMASIDGVVWEEKIKFRDPNNPKKGDGSGGFVTVRTYSRLKTTMANFKKMRDAIGNKDGLVANVDYYHIELDDAQRRLAELQRVSGSNPSIIRVPINPPVPPKPPMTGPGSVEGHLPGYLTQPPTPTPPPQPAASPKPDASIRIIEPVVVEVGEAKGQRRIHRFYIEIKANAKADVYVKLLETKVDPGGQVTNHHTLKDLRLPKSKFPLRSMPRGDRLFIPAPRSYSPNLASTQTVGPFYLTTWLHSNHRGSWTTVFEISHRKDDPDAIRKTIQFAPPAPKGKLIVEYPKAKDLQSINTTGRTVLVRAQVPGLPPGPHRLQVAVNKLNWYVWGRSQAGENLTEIKGAVPYPPGPFTMVVSIPEAPGLGSVTLDGLGSPPSADANEYIARARKRIKARQASDQSKPGNQWLLGDAWLDLENGYAHAHDHVRALECARRAEPLLPVRGQGRHVLGGFRYVAWDRQFKHAFRLGDLKTYRDTLKKEHQRDMARLSSMTGAERKNLMRALGYGLSTDASRMLLMGASPKELAPIVERARAYVKEGSGRELMTPWFPL